MANQTLYAGALTGQAMAGIAMKNKSVLEQ